MCCNYNDDDEYFRQQQNTKIIILCKMLLRNWKFTFVIYGSKNQLLLFNNIHGYYKIPYEIIRRIKQYIITINGPIKIIIVPVIKYE